MSEASEAKRDGARLQKNSGRGQYQKADAIQGDLSVDYKESIKSFTISRKVWAKVCSDAAKNGTDYIPAIKLILGEGLKKVRIAIIPWSHLMHLKSVEERYNALMEERNG